VKQVNKSSALQKYLYHDPKRAQSMGFVTKALPRASEFLTRGTLAGYWLATGWLLGLVYWG
jgi:hypothetical protein